MGSYSFGTTVCAWPAMLDVVNSASDQRLHPPWWPHEPERVPVTCSLADCTDTLCSKGNDYLSKRHLARHFLDAVAARREQLGSHDYDQQANFLFTFQQSAIFTSKVKKCDSFFCFRRGGECVGFCRGNLAQNDDNIESNVAYSLHGDRQSLHQRYYAQQTLDCRSPCRAVSEHEQQYLDENGQQADFYIKRNKYFTARPDSFKYLFGSVSRAECGAVHVCTVQCVQIYVFAERVSIDCLQELLQLVDGVVERRRDELSNCSAN